MRTSRATRWAVLLAVMGVALGWDLAASPEDQRTAALLILAIERYQKTISPILSTAGVECRFEPTCSRYAVAALRQHGTLSGSMRSARRVLRCGPWTPAGTLDPP